MSEFAELQGIILSSIVDMPPASAKDGGFIRKGFNQEVDELRDISTHG